ncbi:MAG: LPXTG cell wall anchor domain-containing protein [Oscillospiraceae bacterium]|nr:LPXTG cell wall anchor domain-containing protein [Oscillospiraceae bacterium]
MIIDTKDECDSISQKLQLAEQFAVVSFSVDGEEADGDVDAGLVEATVENSSGSTLPSTGGIGTTLFYVIGGTLAAGAGVGLIAKKRMKNED